MPAVPEPTTTIKWQCKHCGQIQRVYVGDQSDLTAPDTEAMECYVCKGVELMMGESDFRCIHGELWDEVTITDEMIREYAHIEKGFRF